MLMKRFALDFRLLQIEKSRYEDAQIEFERDSLLKEFQIPGKRKTMHLPPLAIPLKIDIVTVLDCTCEDEPGLRLDQRGPQ